MKEVLKDYFGFSLSSDDDDTIMRSFKNKAQDKLETFNDIMIEYRVNPKLPCKSLMEQAKKKLEELLAIKEPVEFFKTVDKKRDDLLDDADDTAPVFDFFKGGQKKIFEKALEMCIRDRPHPIPVDDYFVNRELTPKDENGEYNFECLEAIDIAPVSYTHLLPDSRKTALHLPGTRREAAHRG